jgi:hypothetical protein
MAIKFTDKGDNTRPAPAKTDDARPDAAREVGKARFASPIEADAPVNPQAGSELPFTELPKAERKARAKKR